MKKKPALKALVKAVKADPQLIAIVFEDAIRRPSYHYLLRDQIVTMEKLARDADIERLS